MDQVRGDEHAAASGSGLDQIDIIAIHDELAVSNALLEPETGDDLCVEIKHSLPQVVIDDGGKNAAFGGKGIGQVKIERVPDAGIDKLIIDGDAFHEELTAFGTALDENTVVGGPARGLGIFCPEFIRAAADLHASASLRVKRLDDDVSADLGVVFERLLFREDCAVGKQLDPQLCHPLSHKTFVGKETSGLIADAGKSELLGHVSHRADGDVCLVCDHAADTALAGIGQDALFVSYVNEKGICDIRLERVGNHRRGKKHVV